MVAASLMDWLYASIEIPKQLVMDAYKAVKANAGAAGVDEQSIKDFEEHLKGNLYRIWNRMSSGCYFPTPVKAVAIPKKNGGERILGIPTVADRVAQTVVKMMFEPMVESSESFCNSNFQSFTL